MSLLAKREIFNAITLIKPAPSSSALFGKKITDFEKFGRSTDAIEEFWGVGENGKETLMDSRPYTKERFSGTIQTLRPSTWNENEAKWMIIDPDDTLKKKVLNENSPIIDELVVNARLLNNRSEHPEFGKYITKADIFDRFDPFFTHPDYEYTLSAGEGYIKSSNKNSLNVLVLLGFIARKMFEVGSTSKYIPRGRSVKFVIIDKDVQRKEKEDKRKKHDIAYEAYKGLSNERKLILATALGFGNIKNNVDLADDILHNYATDDVTPDEKNKSKTKMDVFIDLIQSGAIAIKANYVFQLGVSTGVIRQQNKSYTAFGQKLGVTKSDVIQQFLSSEDVMMSRVEEAALQYTKGAVINKKVQHKDVDIVVDNTDDNISDETDN